MGKKKILWSSLYAIFPFVFNAVFFLTSGLNHHISVWIAYFFVHFAYIMVLLAPKMARRSSSRAVFGFSIQSISLLHFIVQLIISIIVFITKPENHKISLIIQILVSGIFGIFLFSHLLANEHTADHIMIHESEIFYIKDAATRVNELIGRVNDKKIDKEIERVYDLLHSSPLKSSQTVKTIEQNIITQIAELEQAVSKSDVNWILSITKALAISIEQRNRRLRTGV